ncbi:hypothetical protein AGABI2DRAFT_188194 [Agaricus bisporus var. bisporus H97]|uniref:hypothetical protein n=1 Tax=Agaricus bisporus var. bisporus (strain H97 / ATCC MYA-4626 / FGSC 10389) TaxID=936046 RepID=UPI00029F6DC3|nr:hypothetical protein AGABI2DRAFT_188194 [Agaricus bisporus var. bisporus H97]EKV43160.1 hypothetical protein AGABI2DRAFT_188194 [Agaricus bisporus var. bisporus H97]
MNIDYKRRVAQSPPRPPPKASSPRLQRQNNKTTPPTPPKVIVDSRNEYQLVRVGFLGEGGFARVFEVKDPRGRRLACKVVTRDSLKTKKAKTKLWAEIKIHRSLSHPNIVGFHDCFDDESNVYMVLELCTSGSLMDMLRRRRRLTEPETRYFMVQLIGACHYMHTHQVIHRDLKLGNLLLDADMNIKVADFGLAALIENPGERKKTICGTPNYIAPEVLFDTANGHSFEVDTWSIGVILYTLVIGKPPFQTKDVKEIYKRIRDNEYEFPADRKIGSGVKTLIQQILTPDPSQRPTLFEILDHVFFTQGPVPSYIPPSAHDSVPDFSSITPDMSDNNFKRLRRFVFLDHSAALPNNSGALPQNSNGRNITSTIQQQEKEFQKAIQPGSPISVLLKSARQPLLMGLPQSGSDGIPPGANPKESALLRKLQAAKESPLRRNYTNGDDDSNTEEDRRAKKALEAQKARIVAQMAPVREEAEEEAEGVEDEQNPFGSKDKYAHLAEKLASTAPAPLSATTTPPRPLPQIPIQKERVALAPARVSRDNLPASSGFGGSTVTLPRSASTATDLKGKAKERFVNVRGEKENVPTASVMSLPSLGSKAAEKRPEPSIGFENLTKLGGFDAAAQVLTTAFEAKAAGRVFRDYSEIPLPEEKVFIACWVDYCNKYGMGYALTDGSVGVYFNDSTSCVMSPDKVHFDYITSRHHGNAYVRRSYTVDVYPDELKSKVYLLKSFEGYIMEKLFNQRDYIFEDKERTKGMEWVHKYLRMKHVIVFKLSHDILQFNFYDHSKLILSSHGLLVTHIDKNYNLTRHTLSDIMAQSLDARTSDPEQSKFNQKLVDKLKYCKEVLVSIREASAGVAAKQGAGGGATSNGVNQQQAERVVVQQQKQPERERAEKISNVRGKQEAPLGSNRVVHQQQGLLARASRLALR